MAVDERELVAFLLRELLRDVFGTKANMAKELKIPLRTLQWNFQTLDTQKGARASYQRLIAYCAEHEIDLTPYFQRFNQLKQKGSAAVNRSRMPRTERIGGRDMDAIFERMYEMMETLLSEVCAQCKRTGGESGKCAVKQYADMLGRERAENAKGDTDMKNGEIGVLRWMFLEMRREYFQGNNAIMAEILGLGEDDVRRAVEGEGWRTTAEVFERAAQYCLRNGFSLDGLLERYPGRHKEV